ncbi:hypothetical protein GC197_18350 [bacterium]|nr:hypothetical protein [bacterium]
MNTTLDIDGLRKMVLELRARWKAALSALGISEIQLVDLVESADPAFECEVPIPKGEDRLRDRLEHLDYRFQRFPKTASLGSPYEILIHLHDQGCTLITEHRIIDIWSPTGEMLGGVAGMIPWQQEPSG